MAHPAATGSDWLNKGATRLAITAQDEHTLHPVGPRETVKGCCVGGRQSPLEHPEVKSPRPCPGLGMQLSQIVGQWL